MSDYFTYDKRLGIKKPVLPAEWETIDLHTQQQILTEWEHIRGHIPDRIKDVEQLINQKQAQLDDEENFSRSCELNSEIANLASIINDLWIWYRTNQNITSSKKHA
ncbi:hypothetical protein [Priestia koreensis]|uniref:hypothetical protein n=1 Tax=Priestia koreensis TaxID=284581 RepID=UPI00203E5D92|nr:hypothetical protein [Priestia koreensis]MCM3002800.1 hypothetical protein [Priestia koreensis]